MDTRLIHTQNQGKAADDAVSEVDLDFSFSFYGIEYTSINVSTNGNIQFNSSLISWVDEALPAADMNNVIDFYFVDLNPDLSWMQQAQTLGNIVGERVAVVRYVDAPVCPYGPAATHNDTANDTTYIDSQPSVTCDVLLYESDGTIEIRYYHIDATPWNVVIGLQSGLLANGDYAFTSVVNHLPMNDSLPDALINTTLIFIPRCLSTSKVISSANGATSVQGSAAAVVSILFIILMATTSLFFL